MDIVINQTERPVFKVLVIDDEPDSIEHFITSSRRRLRREDGFFMHEFATSLNDAADRISDAAFDLLLVDMGMPERFGGNFFEDGGARFIREMQAGKYGSERVLTKFMVVTAQDLEIQPEEIDRVRACLGVYSKLQYRPMEEVFQDYYSGVVGKEDDVEAGNYLYIDNPSYYVEIDGEDVKNGEEVRARLLNQGLRLASEVFSFRMSTKKPVSYEELALSLLADEALWISLPINTDVGSQGNKQYDSFCVFESGEIRSFGDRVTLDEQAGEFRVEFANIADFIDPDGQGAGEEEGEIALSSVGLLVVVEC